jgi:hypothetical protein
MIVKMWVTRDKKETIVLPLLLKTILCNRNPLEFWDFRVGWPLWWFVRYMSMWHSCSEEADLPVLIWRESVSWRFVFNLEQVHHSSMSA